MAKTSTGSGLAKGARITGASRQALGAQLAERYQAGDSIRTLALETGRSFGFVHGVIKESGVPLRARGGATRRSAPTVAPTALVEAPAADADPAVEGVAPRAEAVKSRKIAAKKTVKKSGTKRDESKKDKSAGKKKGRS